MEHALAPILYSLLTHVACEKALDISDEYLCCIYWIQSKLLLEEYKIVGRKCTNKGRRKTKEYRGVG